MLYQLSYEALLEVGQEQAQFIPSLYSIEWNDVHIYDVIKSYIWTADEE